MSSTRQPLRLVLVIGAAPRSHLFTRHYLSKTSSSATTTTATTSRLTSTLIRSQRRTFQSTRPVDGTKKDEPSPSPSLFSSVSIGPAPPRLPKAEQEIFEALQRQSTGAFSTPRSSPQINQSPDSSPKDRTEAADEIAARADKLASEHKDEEFDKVIDPTGKGEELHPNVRRGAQPEFEGEVNPKTGEVGGPKNEPLRWGAAGEWTYNGRTTDF